MASSVQRSESPETAPWMVRYLLHFLQTSPLVLASTQQGWEQALPAALALSQQDSAIAGAARIAKAKEAAEMSLVMFIAP
jgi:hypothetical protein